MVSVPLNNQLAAVPAASPAAAGHWQHFLAAWLLANHARAVLSLAGCGLLAAALLLGAPPEATRPAGDAAAARAATAPPVPPAAWSHHGQR